MSTIRDEAGTLPYVRRRALDRLMLMLQDQLAPDAYTTAEDLIAEAFNEAPHQTNLQAGDAAIGRRHANRVLAHDAAMVGSTPSALADAQRRFPGLHVKRG